MQGSRQNDARPKLESAEGLMSERNRRVSCDAEGLNTAAWPASGDHFVTPVDLFFTRSHAPVPSIDARAWRLQVDGLVDRPRSFSLEELGRAFPLQEVTATLLCAGLRRDEFLTLGPLPGELPWGLEPISTGRWTGVALGEVLRAVGPNARARYVEFTGMDEVEREGQRFGFGSSIDLRKALSAEVLLATQLNGAPLPPEHGFPLRALVPGWIGARSVKWLGRITLRDDPSPNYFQSRAYRVQREINPRDARDVSGGVALTEVPLNAVIVEPRPNQVVPAGVVRLRGWAMGSGGRPLTGVEVSRTGGADWVAGRLSAEETGWSWAFWEASLQLPRGCHTLAVRATDTAGEVQPAELSATWNVKGYNNNAWHRVAVRAE
jgi:sulfite oxidase